MLNPLSYTIQGYLLNYILLIMLLHLPQFLPSPSLIHQVPPTPSGNPNIFVHVHWHAYKLFGYSIFLCCTLHPHDILYHQFLFLNSHTSSSISPTPPIWQPSSLYPWFSIFLVCLVCFSDSFVDRHVFIATLLFIVLIFLFKKKVPLTLHIIMVWWWWTPLVFSYLGSSLFALQF